MNHINSGLSWSTLDHHKTEYYNLVGETHWVINNWAFPLLILGLVLGGKFQQCDSCFLGVWLGVVEWDL